jgi:SAM-dependent methyltransferase
MQYLHAGTFFAHSTQIALKRITMAWQDGYVCDVEYTTNYFNELSPSFLTYIALLNGYASPDITKPFRYCELGCGQGVSLITMAAANPQGEFYGFDFNPAQIATIRGLAEEAGVENVHFFEISFKDALERYREFGEFDFIVFHGIYSWVNRENQRYLVEFCSKTLRAGGLVYNSYNAMPGWSGLTHMQRLLKESSDLFSDRSDIRAKKSFEFLSDFADTKPLAMGEGVLKWMEGIKKHNVNYIVHEYLHEEWTAHYFLDVAKDMSRAKLDYIAQAAPAEAYEHLVINKEAKRVIAKEVPATSLLYEQMKDYWINRKFRRDLYVKGAHRMPKNLHINRLQNLPFILKVDAESIQNEFSTVLRKTNLKEEIYTTVLTALKQGPVTIAKLQQESDIPFNSLLLALSLFVGNGHVMPSFYQADNEKKAAEYNDTLAQKAVDSDTYRVLAATALGAGVHVTSLDRVIYHQHRLTKNTKTVLAGAVFDHLQAHGMKASSKESFKDDKEHKKYIDKQIKEWREKRLPLWKNIGVL